MGSANRCCEILPALFEFDVLHTVINSVYVQTLPTEQATLVVTDFFSRGHDPFAHACKARPLTIVGRTSVSVSLSLFNFQGAWLSAFSRCPLQRTPVRAK